MIFAFHIDACKPNNAHHNYVKWHNITVPLLKALYWHINNEYINIYIYIYIYMMKVSEKANLIFLTTRLKSVHL